MKIKISAIEIEVSEYAGSILMMLGKLVGEVVKGKVEIDPVKPKPKPVDPTEANPRDENGEYKWIAAGGALVPNPKYKGP